MMATKRNPALVVFGNPARRNGTRSGSTIISRHVQAVAYVHAVDGSRRVHGYGNADIDLKDIGGDGVEIRGLKTRTGVTMVGNADGSVTLFHSDGLPLWGMERDA